jgi:hypothetical protein
MSEEPLPQQFSADGNCRWSGERWESLDGKFYWDGHKWQPARGRIYGWAIFVGLMRALVNPGGAPPY